jgi:hypothetical protein
MRPSRGDRVQAGRRPQRGSGGWGRTVRGWRIGAEWGGRRAGGGGVVFSFKCAHRIKGEPTPARASMFMISGSYVSCAADTFLSSSHLIQQVDLMLLMP